jgi:hypothetical protein
MKIVANRLFLFTAVALSLGTAAYGQSLLRASVPFAFQVPGAAAFAGHYTVRLENSGTGKIVQITNNETGRSTVSLSYALDTNSRGPISPRLVFRCGETGCALSEVWTATAGVRLPVSRVRGPEYLASVSLAAGN